MRSEELLGLMLAARRIRELREEREERENSDCTYANYGSALHIEGIRHAAVAAVVWVAGAVG